MLVKSGDSGLTILDLAHSRLEIVHGQVADLVFEVVEIHGALETEIALAHTVSCDEAESQNRRYN